MTSNIDLNHPGPRPPSRGALRHIAGGNPDVVGVILVDADGRVHATHGADPRLVQVATAIVVPLREMLDRAAAELGCGTLVDTFVGGDSACFALADVDGNRSVVVLGAPSSSPGALRADARFIADGVRAGEEFS